MMAQSTGPPPRALGNFNFGQAFTVLAVLRMAYSLRGCGVVLRSDIEKRDMRAEAVGRSAGTNPAL
jgi:hypothetical protein